MTGGMDNPVGVAFTAGGERVVTSTFFQDPAGGRRDGLIHAVYGGLYGKVHDVIDDHPHTAPDVMPVLAHLGPAAPCGVARYESDAFGREYRDNLFVACFNLRKVTRHALTPDGSTFKSVDTDFLVCDDLDFHPTDVLEDADGSLLVIDTGAWYKLCCPTSQLVKPDSFGAIYRVRRTDAPKIADPRGLELRWDQLAPGPLAKLLEDVRPAVRKRAGGALAARGAVAVPTIRHVLSTSPSVAARLQAVWAATQIDDPAARAAALAAMQDADADVRQAAAHSASVRRDPQAVPALVKLLGGPTLANRRVAAEALGRIGNAAAVPAILAALAQPKDRVLDHSLTYALIEIGDADATSAGLASDSPRVVRAALIALDQTGAGRLDVAPVAAALSSPDPALRATAAWVAARHPEWGPTLAGAFARRLAGSPALADNERDDLRRQLAGLARSPAIQELLAREAGSADAPISSRRTAMRAMADADVKDVPGAWIDAVVSTMAGEAELLPDAVAALRRLRLAEEQAPRVSEPLLRVAERPDVSAAVRLDAFSSIPGGPTVVGPDLFRFLASQLAPAEPATRRLAAAQAMGRAALTREQLLALTDVVARVGATEIDRLLPAFARSDDREVGLRLVAALRSSKRLRGLRVETLKAQLAKFGPEVQAEVALILASLNPDAAKQAAHLDRLQHAMPKGDVGRGRAVFNSQRVGCVSCHAIGYVGGSVGPDLTRVGAVRGQRDLLESIVYPSASFVQTYEPVIVITTDGDNQAGILRRNDGEEVRVLTGPQQEVRIPRARVKEIRPDTLSTMPEGLEQQLSAQELADLLAFLAAAK